MTNQFSRPSLLQAHESNSPSTDTSASRPRSHSRSHAHQHMHHAQSHKHFHGNTHDRTHDHSHNHDSEHDIKHSLSASQSADINSDSSNSRISSDSSSLELREPIAAVEADVKVRRDDNGAPLATHVVQTVSLIQVVDHNGDPIETETRYAPPATVVVDSTSGETVTISGPGVTAEAGIGGFLSSLLPGGFLPPSSDTTTSTRFAVSTSSGAASTDATLSSPSSVTTGPSTSLFPTLSDASNGTALPGNLTIATGNSNSTIRPLLFSAPSSQNSTTTTQANYRLFSTSSSILSTTDLPTSTTSGAGSADTTAAEGVAPTTEADDGGELTLQQKQVIGGVVGGIAGVAVLALLVLLALRYKRKKDAQAPESSDRTGFATIGDGSSGVTGSMAERAGAASAVTAAFAGLAGKRPNRAQEGPPPSGERGFYRVSGRKLPSVLHNGGDGYSDPRQSAMSEQSQYSRDSQISDAIPPGSTPYALGSPMRPVSGVPIMRSGPERTPVTTSNPFADPPPSPPAPPSPLYESPPRSAGSRGSPRASGSRFQESI